MRALEVLTATGKSILQYRNNAPRKLLFNTRCFFLDLPRPQLYERINLRVDEMVMNGLIEEARLLYPHRHLNALQTVGYRELFAYLDGESRMEEAIALIKQNTRHYAKRQGTWFRRWPEFENLPPDAGVIIRSL